MEPDPNFWDINSSVGMVETRLQDNKKEMQGPNNSQGEETSKVSSEPIFFSQVLQSF